MKRQWVCNILVDNEAEVEKQYNGLQEYFTCQLFFLRYIRSVRTVNYFLREIKVLKTLIFKSGVDKKITCLQTQDFSNISEFFGQRYLHFSFHLIRKKKSVLIKMEILLKKRI